jgi:hypothetical protein
MKIKIKDNVEGYWYKAGETYEVEESDFDNWYCYNKGYISTSHADIVIFVDTPGTTSWTGPDGTVFKYPTVGYVGYADPFPGFKPVPGEIVTTSTGEGMYTMDDRTGHNPPTTELDIVKGITDSIQKQLDMVNEPPHYTKGKFECIDVIEDVTQDLKGMEAVCTSQVLKYTWRWKHKNGVEDLKKAQYYLNKLISKLDPNEIP